MQKRIVAVLKRCQAFRMSHAETKAVVLSTLGVTAASLSAAGHAAVDAAVNAGITALEADAATLGGLATGAVVTIMLIVLGIRLVKKLLGRAV